MLALIPLAVALVFAALMMPSGCARPDVVPLPRVDDRVLARAAAADRALAEGARREPLSPETRELGSAIREFHTAEAEGGEVGAAGRLNKARAGIDGAVARVLGSGDLREVKVLRALQLQAFLAELQHFEATGAVSPELEALGGTYVRSMHGAGWLDGSRILMNEGERRAAFKLTWNKLVGLENQAELALAPDELRQIYSFYFRHPHVPEAKREGFRGRRQAAKDREACERLAIDEEREIAGWLLAKLKEYAAIDPGYPLAYARGVALYGLHDYVAAAQAFQDWLEEHPNGAWALRARNHRAAALAEMARSF